MRAESNLSRAVGFDPQLDIDYRALPVEKGDAFLLASDGVYEHVDAAFMVDTARQGRSNLDAAARAIVGEAYRRGSPDNLTVQIVVVDAVPSQDPSEVRQRWRPCRQPPPLLGGRTILDGYRIVREVHGSSRSHTTWRSTSRRRCRSS